MSPETTVYVLSGDYGKYKYEAKKKASEAKKKQVVVHLKEVKLRPKTDEHDYDTKIKNVRRFLEVGDKARIKIMFRGREITYKEIGQQILKKIVEDLKDVGVTEQPPRMEGRQMFMILAPNPKYRAALREQKAQQTPRPGEGAPRPAQAGGGHPQAGAPVQAAPAKTE